MCGSQVCCASDGCGRGTALVPPRPPQRISRFRRATSFPWRYPTRLHRHRRDAACAGSIRATPRLSCSKSVTHKDGEDAVTRPRSRSYSMRAPARARGCCMSAARPRRLSLKRARESSPNRPARLVDNAGDLAASHRSRLRRSGRDGVQPCRWKGEQAPLKTDVPSGASRAIFAR
jgi:hypothetical protein